MILYLYRFACCIFFYICEFIWLFLFICIFYLVLFFLNEADFYYNCLLIYYCFSFNSTSSSANMILLRFWVYDAILFFIYWIFSIAMTFCFYVLIFFIYWISYSYCCTLFISLFMFVFSYYKILFVIFDVLILISCVFILLLRP